MIRLNKNWGVRSDRWCVTICSIKKYKSGKNKGKENVEHMWHYQNYEQALEGLIDRDIQGLGTLKDIVKRIKTLKSDVRKMLKEHNLDGVRISK